MQGIRFFEKIVSSFFLWVRRDKVCVRVLVKRTCALEKKIFLHLITIPFFFWFSRNNADNVIFLLQLYKKKLESKRKKNKSFFPA